MSVDNDLPLPDVELTGEPDASQAKPRSSQAQLAGLVMLALLAGLLWHVHTRIDPSLIYYGDLVELPSQQSFLVTPIFARGSEFLQPFLARPGGLAEWAGAYLAQYFGTPYAGTLILGLLAVVVFVTTNRIATAMSGCPTKYMGFWPVLLLVVIWGRYLFHLGDCLALCAALLACVVYLRLDRPMTRVVALSGGTVVLYYVIGAPALLFAGMCGLAELIRWRLWWLGALALGVGAVVPIVVGVWVLGSTVADAYARMSGPYPHGLRSSSGAFHWVRLAAWLGIYGVCLLAVAVGGLKSWWARRQNRDLGEGGGPSTSPAGIACPAALVVAAAAVLLIAFDTEARSLLRIHRYAMKGQWERLLEETRQHPLEGYSSQALREINRALAEVGQLGSRMFAYPQDRWSLFAPMTATHQSVTECRTFMALGLINQAENLTAELLTTWGPHPTLLRVMAQIFIIKGETEAATVFLNRLAKDVVHGAWAEQTLDKLRTDPMLSDDPEITHYRSMIQTVEVFDLTYSGMLLGLVKEDPGKYRMAFEYLMGVSLLHRPAERTQLVDHIKNIAALMVAFVPEMGYESLPEHYCEVRVLHAAMTGQEVPLEAFLVHRATTARWKRCYKVLSEHEGDMDEVDAILAEDMPGSYFRYFNTGRSGGALQR